MNKNHPKFTVIILLCTAWLLDACEQKLEAEKIYCKDGVYCQEGDIPFTGKAVYRFPTHEREVSTIRIFKNGMPVSSKYFGYDHELISVDTISLLPAEDVADLPAVRKVVFVHGREGQYSSFSIIALIADAKPMTDSTCQQIFEAIVNTIKRNNPQLKLPKAELLQKNLEIEVATGVYETPICSMKY